MKNISPHVQIYKFPLTAISSITNRITGLGLTGMYIGLGTSCLLNQNQTLIDKYDKSNQIIKTGINYIILFPNIYHTYGGLRHFIWDKYPQYITNKLAHKSSIALFSISILSTILSERYILNKNIKNIL